MKVLLLTPIISNRELWGQYEKGGGSYFPIGLLSIAAVLKERNHEVALIDASTLRWNEERLLKHLKDNVYDVIGFGNAYTALVHVVFRTAKLCRRVLPTAKFVIGGIHPTLFPRETLEACPEIDYAVFGEGELTLLELIEFLQNAEKTEPHHIKGVAYRDGSGQIKMTGLRPVIGNLAEIPPLPYDLLEVKKYTPPPSNYKCLPTFGFLVQRGCPYRCAYCDPRIHGKIVRHESISKIIDQMKYLKDSYGMKGILFHDSCLTINRKFASNLFQRMIQEDLDLTWTCFTRVDKVDPELLALMKRAGCWSVAFGLESGNDVSLQRVQKGVTVKQNIEGVQMAKEAGLEVIGSFILGLPGEDEAMTLNTIHFAKRLKLSIAVFFLPVPFYGTRLYEMCKEEGGLVDNIQWDDFKQWMDQENPLYINPLIGKERMVGLYNYAMKSFYLSPDYILRSVCSIRSFEDFKKYLTGFESLTELFKRHFFKTKTNIL